MKLVTKIHMLWYQNLTGCCDLFYCCMF